MSDRWAALLALSVAAGALVARPVPVVLAVLVVGGALAVRWPALLCVGAALLAAGLAARAWDGLVPPARGPVDGRVTLLADPVDVGGAVRVEVRVAGKRLEAWAWGGAAGRLRHRLAGEAVEVQGRVVPFDPAVRGRMARRHLVARLEVDRVGAWTHGDPVSAAANAVRRLLVDGAAPLDPAQRSLYTGIVLGDDRAQPADLADDFRAAGLTHLLAVSGQNVAFVLAVAAPVLRRLGWRVRLPATVAVLAFFALVVRFEPSVLRAAAMAGTAAVAAGLGRPASSRRVLALAAAGVLLVDPFLVRSVGFLLSVGASGAIVLLAAPLAARLPGPRWLAEPAAVTLAAQVGTAPVLLPVFGGLPVAALPANLLAVPAAGPLMMWGVSGGLAAGVAARAGASWLTAVLQVPSVLLVEWISAVAGAARGLGWGELGASGSLAVAGLLGAALGSRLVPCRPAVRRAVAAGAVVGLVGVVVHSAPSPPDRAAGHVLAGGGQLWRAPGDAAPAGTVLVVTDPRPSRLLESCRRAGIEHVDVLVSPAGGVQAAEALAPLQRRLRPRLLLVPAGHAVAGGTVPPAGTELRVGGVVVAVGATSPRLEVQVRLLGEPARDPPSGVRRG